MKNSRPRGTKDIFYPESSLYQKVNLSSIKTLNTNNYNQVIFPTYEHQEIFSSLGDSSDIVQKEMFFFKDKKDRSLALRPEGTISVARLVSQNNLIKNNHPLKLYYWANMFRYERPQRGRYREFWQLGVEIINADGILADCEILQIAKTILENLGIHNTSFSINYLGDEKTKNSYKEKLKKSLESKFEKLCSDCKCRYENNPLRIIDCKTCSLINEIPNYEESLSSDDLKYLKDISSFLEKINFNYVIDQKIVRGLDYYTGIVFEVKIIGEEKSLIGGGRYNNLFSKFNRDNKKIPAVGFALGVDRLIDFIGDSIYVNSEKKLDLLLISLDENSISSLFLLRNKILNNIPSVSIELNLEKNNHKKIINFLDFYNPKIAIVVGNKEIKEKFFSVRITKSKEIYNIDEENIIIWLKKKLNI